MRDDLEHDRLESTWDRWQQLPLGYRVNAGLYVLGFISLVVLLAQVVSGTGSKPRQVEVASRAPTTTHTTLPTTTSTTKAPPTTVAATTAAPAAPAPTSSGSSGGSTRARTVDTDPIQGFPPPPTCRDSSDPVCGTFSWDPPAGNNLPITIIPTAAPASAGVGETVTFTVNVSDGDHQVSDNCAVINFGDGTSASPPPPCQPINCPATFGPWNTPGRFPGSNTFTYTHTYMSAGTFIPTFEFHTDRDRCPDPYGNFGRGSTTVTVSPPAT